MNCTSFTLLGCKENLTRFWACPSSTYDLLAHKIIILTNPQNIHQYLPYFRNLNFLHQKFSKQLHLPKGKWRQNPPAPTGKSSTLGYIGHNFHCTPPSSRYWKFFPQKYSVGTNFQTNFNFPWRFQRLRFHCNVFTQTIQVYI